MPTASGPAASLRVRHGATESYPAAARRVTVSYDSQYPFRSKNQLKRKITIRIVGFSSDTRQKSLDSNYWIGEVIPDKSRGHSEER